MSYQFRKWVFTWNNYTKESEEILQKLDTTYLLYGYEVGAQGTKHLQGYLEMTKKKTWEGLSKKMKGAWLEPAKDAKAAQNYCKGLVKGKKPNEIFEKGEPMRQGSRNDLAAIQEIALQGGMRGVLSSTTNLQAVGYAKEYLKYFEEERTWKTEVYWIWGEPRSGKSRKAREMLGYFKENPIETRGIKPYSFDTNKKKWWNGYDRHDTVVIDDIRRDHLDFTALLAITDEYEYQVETKGGMRQLLAKKIVICTIAPPEIMFKDLEGEPIEQILGRIKEVIYWKRSNWDKDYIDPPMGSWLNKNSKMYKDLKKWSWDRDDSIESKAETIKNS